MECGKAIAWYDNVPVLSWLLLRGRCRNCGTSISWRYPAVELATALLVAGCFWKFGLSWDAAVASFFCVVLVVLSAIDIDRRIVPNKIVLPAAAIVLVAQTVLHPSVEWLAAGSRRLALPACWPPSRIPAAWGWATSSSRCCSGLALGRTVPIAMFAGMLAALVPSAVLFARHGSAARKMAIPFAPFLALGGLLALFAGHPLARTRT